MGLAVALSYQSNDRALHSPHGRSRFARRQNRYHFTRECQHFVAVQKIICDFVFQVACICALQRYSVYFSKYSVYSVYLLEIFTAWNDDVIHHRLLILFVLWIL